jgi:hypothetical protein
MGSYLLFRINKEKTKMLELNKSTINASTYISVMITPELFLNLYTKIYMFDPDIIVFKEIAFILSIIFMILGIVGNVMCIYAFLHRKLLEHKFNWYLLIVSFFKLMFCSTLFTDYFFSKIYKDPIFLHNLNETSSKIVDYIIHTTDACIVVLTIFLSVDRYYAIKKPMFIKDFLTNLYAKHITLICTLTVILFKVIVFFVCNANIDGRFHIAFCTIIVPTLVNTIPLIIVLVLNVLLVKEVVNYYSNQERKSTDIDKGERLEILVKLNNFKRGSSANQRLTIRSSVSFKLSVNQKSHYIMIIVTDIWFILTSCPYYILNSYFVLFQMNFFNIETLVKIQILSSVIFNLNHCMNFFIYFSFYEDFRQIFIFSKFQNKKLFKKKNSMVTTV